MHRIVWLLVTVIMTTGCARAMSDRELQRVGRDWSMVVRASQIIPVYPLTETCSPATSPRPGDRGRAGQDLS